MLEDPFDESNADQTHFVNLKQQANPPIKLADNNVLRGTSDKAYWLVGGTSWMTKSMTINGSWDVADATKASLKVDGATLIVTNGAALSLGNGFIMTAGILNTSHNAGIVHQTVS